MKPTCRVRWSFRTASAHWIVCVTLISLRWSLAFGRLILPVIGASHFGAIAWASEAPIQSPTRRHPLAVDDSRLNQLGIRKLAVKNLAIYTDLPLDREVQSLAQVFDQAIGQWCDYFGVAQARAERWRVTGYVMKSKEPFKAAGLLSDQLPSAYHGYSIDREFWLFEQPSSYYRRHLLLHEATHSFMNTFLGSCGPSWYMEGIAELLATHRLADGKLTLGHFPESREEVPHWGRIKPLKEAANQGKVLTIEQVLELQPGGDATTVGYAWAWALAAFLDGHPRYRDRFRQLGKHVIDEEFNERLRAMYAGDWNDLALEWRLFLNDLDYGYDLQRAAIKFAGLPTTPETGVSRELTIDAGRGWQAAGFHVEAGVAYQLWARGDYQIDSGPPAWASDPNGVSIHYYQGHPIGQLLAGVRPDEPNAAQDQSFLHPVVVGRGTKMRSSRSGDLYLKINESPAKLFDNCGALTVEINRL